MGKSSSCMGHSADMVNLRQKKIKYPQPHISFNNGWKKGIAVNKKIYWDYTQSRLLLHSRGRTHPRNDIPDISVSKHQKPGVILPPSGHTQSLPSLIQMRKSLSSKALQIQSLNCKRWAFMHYNNSAHCLFLICCICRGSNQPSLRICARSLGGRQQKRSDMMMRNWLDETCWPS